MADTALAVTRPVYEKPQYKDPLRFKLLEPLEGGLKQKFRQHALETAQELLLELAK